MKITLFALTMCGVVFVWVVSWSVRWTNHTTQITNQIGEHYTWVTSGGDTCAIMYNYPLSMGTQWTAYIPYVWTVPQKSFPTRWMAEHWVEKTCRP